MTTAQLAPRRRMVAAVAAVVTVAMAFAAWATPIGASMLTAVIGVGSGPKLMEIHRVEAAHFESRPGAPVFALIVGTDYRPGVDGHRADAIHLVGVNPVTGQGTILNIPRDTWVGIPGRGSNKINAAHTFGGPQLLAAAVAGLTGIHPQFVVVTDFAGFVGMVDELGGFEVDVTAPMADKNSGAYFDPGRIRMNGHQALAFSRNRYVEGGDFTRSANQAHLIIAALAELRGRGTSPVDTARYTGVLLRHTVVAGTTVADLYRMGRLALAVDPANLRNVTMPGAIGAAGGQSVVLPAAPAADLFADMADDAVLQRY